MKQVIAVHGLMGSGKSTFSTMLLERMRGTVRPFAKPIKDIAHEMGWNGIKDAKGRRLLQLLGTEVGRECIRDTLWVDKWQASLHNTGTEAAVVCDDLRFKNEYEHLVALSRNMPVSVVHIVRPEERKPLLVELILWVWAGRACVHKSEAGIKFDARLKPYVIVNDGTLADLENKVGEYIARHL